MPACASNSVSDVLLTFLNAIMERCFGTDIALRICSWTRELETYERWSDLQNVAEAVLLRNTAGAAELHYDIQCGWDTSNAAMTRNILRRTHQYFPRASVKKHITTIFGKYCNQSPEATATMVKYGTWIDNPYTVQRKVQAAMMRRFLKPHLYRDAPMFIDLTDL